MTAHEHGHHHDRQATQADLLDLDAEVFAAAVTSVLEEIDRLADAPVRTILDLGAGTGAGTFALLRHFADATAVAVDSSPGMLDGIKARAETLGVARRVRTSLSDLDHETPPVDPVDLAWASASLHHLADPTATLARLAGVVRPGGLLVVLEVDGFPRFVPGGTSGHDAESRAHALLAADRAVDLPTMGRDWGPLLRDAGLTVESSRELGVDPAAVPRALLGTYAATAIDQLRHATAERLGPVDVAALAALVDGGPDDVRHRADLRVAGGRRVWFARRASRARTA